MPDASPDPTSATPPKKRRFRLRYSLRSLLIFVLLLFIACGCVEDGFFGNVHYDRIQGPTISGAVMIVKSKTVEKPMWAIEGVIARVEAGKGGGELSIGYGGFAFDDPLGVELAAKVSVLQTWGDPVGAEPDQAYIGVGLDFMFMLVYVTVSHYWHVAGNDDEHESITSVGVGLGL